MTPEDLELALKQQAGILGEVKNIKDYYRGYETLNVGLDIIEQRADLTMVILNKELKKEKSNGQGMENI